MARVARFGIDARLAVAGRFDVVESWFGLKESPDHFFPDPRALRRHAGMVCRLAVPSPVNNRKHAQNGSGQYNVALALFRAECRGARAGCSDTPRSATMPRLQVEVGQNLPNRGGRTESEHVLWQRVQTITTKRSPILGSTRREKSPTEPTVRIRPAPPNH